MFKKLFAKKSKTQARADESEPVVVFGRTRVPSVARRASPKPPANPEDPVVGSERYRVPQTAPAAARQASPKPSASDDAKSRGAAEYNAFLKAKKAEIARSNPSMTIGEVHDTAKNAWFASKGKPQKAVVPTHVVKEHGVSKDMIVRFTEQEAMLAYAKTQGITGTMESKAAWGALNGETKWKWMEPLVAPMIKKKVHPPVKDTVLTTPGTKTQYNWRNTH